MKKSLKKLMTKKELETIKDFIKTGIPKCPKCEKPFTKKDKYTWLPSCKCFKKPIALMVG